MPANPKSIHDQLRDANAEIKRLKSELAAKNAKKTAKRD